MTDWRQLIVVDFDVQAGKPVVKGTRLAVDFILGLLAAGWTEEQLLENYPTLSRDSLRAIFAFAAEALGDESVYPTRRKTGQLLLADENVPLASIRVLRSAGHDVSSGSDLFPGAPDSAVLSHAAAEARVLITFDRDVGALVFGQVAISPPGIVYLGFEPSSPDEPAAILLEVFSRTDIRILGKLTVIDRDRVRQRPLPSSNKDV